MEKAVRLKYPYLYISLKHYGESAREVAKRIKELGLHVPFLFYYLFAAPARSS